MVKAELNERLQDLLERSIEDYIKNYVPIASGTIRNKTREAMSPATIRTDLKILEQMGYLKQVHTSGGRIPTTQGYRFYVNRVMGMLRVKHGELALAAETISDRVGNLPGVIEDICKKLEQHLSYPIIVKREFDKLIVKEVRVIPLVEGSTMVLIRTAAGSITQTIQADVALTERACEDASSALTVHVAGKTLGEMIKVLPSSHKDLKKELGDFKSLVMKLSEKLEDSLAKNFSHHMNVIKLLDIPDYGSVEKVRTLGRVMEDQETLQKAMASDGQVVIGTEVAEDLKDTSIIKFDYQIAGERVASVGILGPERMDYKSLITALYSLLSTTAENRLIEGGDNGRGRQSETKED